MSTERATSTRLAITSAVLEEAIRRASSSGRAVPLALGRARCDRGQDLYIGEPALGAVTDGDERAILHYLVAGRREPSTLTENEQRSADAVLLISGQGAVARLRAWHRTSEGFQLIGEVRLIGPGMPVLKGSERVGPAAAPVPLRWSRVAGALGEPAWRRLRELRLTVVGCGRNGSLVADALTRMGVGRLDLIDPDRVEIHNLDAMAAADTMSVGHPKAAVLAAAANAVWPAGTVEAHLGSATALGTLDTLTATDLVITTVDHDGARWAVNAIAALYLKPVLDIGTGVLVAGDRREAGGDVRLVLPGQACLACFGGLSGKEQIAATQLGPLTEARQAAGRVWRDERAGSLRSVNQTATGLGLRLLEAFVVGDLDRSTWVQLSFAPDGTPQVSTTTPPRTPRSACEVCNAAGQADAGLARLRASTDLVKENAK